MSSIGPWTRKPEDEVTLKKEVDAFFAQEEQFNAAHDLKGAASLIDWPVTFLTDDGQGRVEVESLSMEAFFHKLQPFYEALPKDRRIAHQYRYEFISDSLVEVMDDLTMSVGTESSAGRSMCVLVKKDGEWKRKVIAEPGWGGSAPAPR